MKGYWFNSSHEEALALNRADYCPSRMVRRMEADLALLPAWWARQGEAVLVSEEESALTFLRSREPFVSGIRPLSFRMASRLSDVEPWGWDARSVQVLSSNGVLRGVLPSLAQVEEVRRLSSRQMSVEVLKSVRSLLGTGPFIGRSRWVETSQDLAETLTRWPEVLVKSPWSCSGRGLFRLHQTDAFSSSRALSVLRKQGGLDVEPVYDRVADFAMEFFSDGVGNVSFAGLSWFESKEGKYAGNLVASDESIARRIEKYVDRSVLQQVRETVAQVLSNRIAPFYRGPLGVDMMICRTADGTFAVHPCVEVNVRRTMGWVALGLRRCLAEGVEAFFSLVVEQAPELLQTRVKDMTTRCSLQLSDGRISSGLLTLTPVEADTRFCALLSASPL